MSSKTSVAAHPEHAFQDPKGPNQDFSLKDEPANPLGAMATNKRKRDTTDHDSAGAQPTSGERATRRSSFKRSSSTNANSIAPNDASGPANEINDPSDASFLSAHDNPSFAGHGPENLQNSSSTSLDFSAMSQHHGGEHAAQQNGEPDVAGATSTAAAALAGIYPNMTVPQPTEVSFANTAAGSDGDRNLDPSFGMGEHDGGQNQLGQEYIDALARGGQSDRESGGQKPPVGSDEWHRVRRDNHKEVERRRRETINEGINELAKIVPGCEKNKGSILQRAVSFITQLKENEAQNIEKWTLEKLLTEQAIAELSGSVDKLKNECERAWREAETWKKTCQNAGLNPRQDSSGSNEDGSGDG
ncbi:MAG: basic helix-loop-helix protein [Sclerophora amabilis]|nr:MAG: basic helix-loop-helix protein [Sclerophora amabilis]